MIRNIRMATGLTLFAYAACHFASHASGLFRLDAMDAVRLVVLAPWRTWAGRGALFGALAIHGTLGLLALYRRRHLRIPPGEAWQLGLGLLIPLLMIPHATNVRLGAAIYGLDDSYYRILYQYWVTPPLSGLARQLCLLAAVWIHGCVGLHFWLRTQRWYPAWRATLLGGAVLLPTLAVLGLMNAGWDTTLTAAQHPDFAAAHGPPPAGSAHAIALAALHDLWFQLQLAYAGLVLLILGLRAVRNVRNRRVAAFRITYSDGRVVRAPHGFSVLEASRWARIPHVSMCGGRGRCSTCRVRITRGLDALPPPSPMEAETLRRIAAPGSVRLACQVRPRTDVGVTRLLASGLSPVRAAHPVSVDARELHITGVFIDLRESTRLAAGRLPFDALFLIERYVQRVSSIVAAHRGHVTSVAGDGVMSMFGADPDRPGSPGAGARDALEAAVAVWEGLNRLSDELRTELARPLAFGIGVHSGVAAVGSILVSGRPSLQFLGDTGNVAARLESASKQLGCTLVVSGATLALAGVAARDLVDVAIAGRDGQPCPSLPVRDLGAARALLDRGVGFTTSRAQAAL